MQNFWKINPARIVLLTIILTAITLRLYGLDWDQGSHLHPDERAIVMFSLPLHFPENFSEFFSPNSPLNPHFFAYGNLPIYLLKAVGSLLSNFNPLYLSYDKINLVGRVISAIADVGTLILLFFLTKKLFNQKVGLISSFFYAISVFPIQASHFYAVDVLLTFFILLNLYQLIRFYKKPSLRNSILVGICFGASLATKISAIPLLVAITAAIAIDFLLLVLKQPHKPHIWFPHVPLFLKRLVFDGAVIISSTAIIFVILQPYAIIDFNTFWKQNMEQSQMTRDAFTFPYTLQYVGKIPYLYELKNIFFWGQGPILATLSFLGTLYVSYKTMKQRNSQAMIILIFFFTYFFIVGRFAVGWMRYMLPLYPLLSLFAALFVLRLYLLIKDKLKMPAPLFMILNSLFIILVLVWPFSFMHIYTQPNTRVLASQWINKNISTGTVIATEHWDDGLPLVTQGNYQVLELPMYESDTPIKWDKINLVLKETEYIIIASNRLYTPLMKLTNCEKLPLGRCYKETAKYYQNLFDGKLGFKKVAEFSIYPKFHPPIGRIKFQIRDEGADESFTVYDHPKVMIFQREK